MGHLDLILDRYEQAVSERDAANAKLDRLQDELDIVTRQLDNTRKDLQGVETDRTYLREQLTCADAELAKCSTGGWLATTVSVSTKVQRDEALVRLMIAVMGNRLVSAIKEIRSLTGLNLREAKALVDRSVAYNAPADTTALGLRISKPEAPLDLHLNGNDSDSCCG